MSTHINCHEILSELRINLGEYSESFLSASESMQRYRNAQLMREINRAQGFLYAMIAKRQPSLFVTSVNLTGVDSVFTLPTDFGRLALFRDDKGRKVYSIVEDERRRADATGNQRIYYPRGKTFVLDKSGVTDTYELIYLKLCRPIHCGIAPTGAAASMTLDPNYGNKTEDYYNNMILENVTQDWVDTITDYSNARVATIAETAVDGDVYGLVSDLPEWAHTLIAPKALIEAKLKSPHPKLKPTKAEVTEFKEQLVETMRLYLVRDDTQVDWADLFTNFGPSIAAGGMIVSE